MMPNLMLKAEGLEAVTRETMPLKVPQFLPVMGLPVRSKRQARRWVSLSIRSSFADAAGAPLASRSQMALIPALLPVSVNAERQYEGTFPGPRMIVRTSAMQVLIAVAQNAKKILRKRLRITGSLRFRAHGEEVAAAAHGFDPLAFL